MSRTLPIHPYRDPVRSYVETLVIRCGFADLPVEEKVELAEALLVEARKRVGMELFARLDDASLAYFDRLASDEADEDEIEAFFSVRVPDAGKRVEAALLAFGDECLRAVEEVGTAV